MGEGAFGMDQDLDNADYWFRPVVTDTYEANCAITEATRPPRRTQDTCKSLVNPHTLNSLFLFRATYHSKANCHSRFFFDMQRLHSADPWLFRITARPARNLRAWNSAESERPAFTNSYAGKLYCAFGYRLERSGFRPGLVLMGTCVIEIWRHAALWGTVLATILQPPPSSKSMIIRALK